jgi:hypothetical protein
MPRLAASRLCAFEEEWMHVGPSGTVRVLENTYSVPSPLRKDGSLGSDFQGHDDHRRGDRSSGTSLGDH